MLKTLTLVFLWIAGFALVAHPLLPHHHLHEISEVSCADTGEHEHNHYSVDSQLTDLFSQSDCCDHPEGEAPCSFDTKTVVEKSNSLFAFLFETPFKVAIYAQSKVAYTQYLVQQRIGLHVFNCPPRAPPIA